MMEAERPPSNCKQASKSKAGLGPALIGRVLAICQVHYLKNSS